MPRGKGLVKGGHSWFHCKTCEAESCTEKGKRKTRGLNINHFPPIKWFSFLRMLQCFGDEYQYQMPQQKETGRRHVGI